MQFTFTPEEANVVLNVLAKQPYELVSGIIQKIIEQAKEQAPVEDSE